MADVFRKEYKELSEQQKALMNSIKTQAETLYTLMEEANTSENGREIACAKTKLEEAVMWAVKGITA